jgi:hypothetical protein
MVISSSARRMPCHATVSTLAGANGRLQPLWVVGLLTIYGQDTLSILPASSSTFPTVRLSTNSGFERNSQRACRYSFYRPTPFSRLSAVVTVKQHRLVCCG